MNVIVFGASGKTGQELVRQSLEAGHTVTAYLRNPAKLPVQHERLRVIQGDVFDAPAVIAACAGQEAALVALGGKPTGPQPCAPGTLHIVQGLHAHGGRRLVCLTSLGVGDSKGEAGWLFERLLVPLLLRAEMADKNQQEAVVRGSGLEWVIARPGGLTNAPGLHPYRAMPHWTVPGTPRIARSDVAHFMVSQLESDSWLGQAVALGN